MPGYRSAFNKWAALYDEHVTRASTSDDWMFGGYDAVLDKIAAYCELEKNHYSSILDIGTGTGNLAARFLKPGVQVYGLEPSKKNGVGTCPLLLKANTPGTFMTWLARFNNKVLLWMANS